MYILPIYDETILTLSVWHVIFSVLRLSGYLMMNIPPLIEAKKREKQSSQNQETTGIDYAIVILSDFPTIVLLIYVFFRFIKFYKNFNFYSSNQKKFCVPLFPILLYYPFT